jgi:hypothetical protein
MRSGDTFIPKTSGGHLYVIIALHDGRFLAAYITTCRSNSDLTTLLHAGDHPFIQHPSCVAYGKVEKFTANSTAFTPHKPASPHLVERICEGILLSPRVSSGDKTPPRIEQPPPKVGGIEGRTESPYTG